jgi:hypothetical protein
MTMLTARATWALAATAFVATLVLGAAPASGGLLRPDTCGPRQVSQPFVPWLDHAHYFLAPNGGFEEGSNGWTLGPGAAVVDGNESFHVGGEGDSHSLSIPAGGWAATGTLCVDSDEPSFRFFARNGGSLLSTLVVQARVCTVLLGIPLETALPVGIVPGTATSWQPTLPFLFALSANQLLGGTASVSFRFAALGGPWQIDDVYVDPFKDR